MKKLCLILVLSLVSSNILASEYTVVLEDSESNTKNVNVSNENNLTELLNEASQQQIRIKSINVNSNKLIQVDKFGGGEGGEGGWL